MAAVRLVHLSGVAGADEAGRGPLAGPVVCAAVILPDDFEIDGLNDSKQLTAESRVQLALRIRAHAIFAVEVIGPETIDRINILQASLLGMRNAVSALSLRPIRALVDGNKIPHQMPVPTEAIVKGDGSYACIAAASILAKTERDRIMCDYAGRFPEYGFDRHFGYPTPEHFAAISAHGPCPIHRLSFRPFRPEIQPELFA